MDNKTLLQDQSSRSKDKILDFSPRGYLIRYPLLVDACVKRFVDDFQDDFKQLKNGCFKLKIQLSQKALRELLSRYLDESISSVLSRAHQGLSPSANDWIIIVDTGSDRRVSYEMVEKDIDIGLKRLETIFNSSFNRSMKQKRCDERRIYCKHRLLTTDDWIKICEKKVFGKASLIVADKGVEPKCVYELYNEGALQGLTKKESTLTVKEATDWILSQCSH